MLCLVQPGEAETSDDVVFTLVHAMLVPSAQDQSMVSVRLRFKRYIFGPRGTILSPPYDV